MVGIDWIIAMQNNNASTYDFFLNFLRAFC